MASCSAQEQTEEAEAEEKTCRLCFGEDDDEGPLVFWDPLVQPCACRGSAKWIHERCLEQWRRTSPKEDAAYRCGQCMDEYRDALSIELLSARLQAKRADGEDTRSTLRTLAKELHSQGKYDEAEPLFREVLEVERGMLGTRHHNTLGSINNLGVVLSAKGNLTAAEPLCREALEAMRETLGDRHPDTLSSITILGRLLQRKGDLAAAESLLCEAVEGTRETLGNRHASTLISIYNLGSLLQAKGDLTASEPLLREALNGRSETLGDRHPHTLASIASIKNLTALSTTSKAKLRTEVKELRARLNVLRGNERRPTEPWKLAEFNELAPFFVEKKQRLRRMVAWYDLKYVVA